MLSEESIATGLYTLELIAITAFIPLWLLLLLLGNKTGPLLEWGGKGMNFVVFETASAETTPVIELLCNTNVTVCGSATVVGLYHVTLCPALISTCWGMNTVNGAAALPPPAAIFIVLLFCYCCCCSAFTSLLFSSTVGLLANAAIPTRSRLIASDFSESFLLEIISFYRERMELIKRYVYKVLAV